MPIIRLEHHLTDEQLVKLYLQYKKEEEEEREWCHAHPLWDEAKKVVELMKPEILEQMKAKIIDQQSLIEEVG